jgi:hypothetical protein
MLEQIITFRIDSQLMIVSKYLGKDAKPDNFLLKRSQQIFIKSKYSGKTDLDEIESFGLSSQIAFHVEKT